MMQTQEDFNNNIIRLIFVCGIAYASWKYWQWQQRAGRKNGTAESWRALLQFAGNATANPFAEDAVSRERVPTKAAKRKKGAQRPAQPVQQGASKADSVAADGTAVSGPAQSKASATQRQSAGPSALQLLEAASSGSSSPRSSGDLEDFKKQGGLDVLDLGLEGADAKRTNDELSAGRVCLLHDVRLGRMSEGVSSSLAALSEELFGRSVWDILSKKNKLRVAACLRWNSDSYQALGLAVYRLQQNALQVAFLGVASAYRGQGIGRSLVRALREAAKREQLCLSIVTLLPAPAAESGLQEAAASDDSMPFWRAVGFRRCELEGLADGQVCLNIEVRKLGKRQKSSSLAANQSARRELLVWSEVIAAAPKAAPPPAEPTSFLRLPPPPPRAGAAAASEELLQAPQTVPEPNERSAAPRPEEACEGEAEEEDDDDGDDEEEDDDADVEEKDLEDEEGAEGAIEMDCLEHKCKEDANAVIVEDDYGEAVGAWGDDDAGEGNGEEWAGAVAVDDNDAWGAEGEAQASLPTAAGSGFAEAGEQEWAGALSAEAAGMSPKVLWGDEEEDDETLRLGAGDARGAFSRPGWSDPGLRSGPDQNREEQKQAGRWRAGAGKGKGKSAQATSPDDAQSRRSALKGSQSAQVSDASHTPSRPAARLPAVGRGADGAVLDPEVVAGVEAPLESPPGLRSSDDKELQASSLRLRGWCREGEKEDEECEANAEGEGEGEEEDDDDEEHEEEDEEEDEEELRAEVKRLRASLAAMDASTTEEEPETELLTPPTMAAPRLQLRTATSGWMPTLRHTRGITEPGKGKAKGR